MLETRKSSKPAKVARAAQPLSWGLFIMAILIGVAGLLIARPAAAADANFSYYSGEIKTPVDHSAWGAFQRKYVSPGPNGINLVAYGNVTAEDRAKLEAYIASLEVLDPTRFSGDEAFSYWVNLYNAATVKVVLDNYPVKSIRSIRSGFKAGPWQKKLVKVNGTELSLDDIEHNILRKYWVEMRVHYAVNCASMGCPNLSLEPYTGAKLDAQLDAAARAYINAPRGARIDNGKLVVSSIYRWYKEDFGNSDAAIIKHLRQYADKDLAMALSTQTSIDSYDYDWSLNDSTK